jgi:hypothetical protein
VPAAPLVTGRVGPRKRSDEDRGLTVTRLLGLFSGLVLSAVYARNG